MFGGSYGKMEKMVDVWEIKNILCIYIKNIHIRVSHLKFNKEVIKSHMNDYTAVVAGFPVSINLIPGKKVFVHGVLSRFGSVAHIWFNLPSIVQAYVVNGKTMKLRAVRR